MWDKKDLEWFFLVGKNFENLEVFNFLELDFEKFFILLIFYVLNKEI